MWYDNLTKHKGDYADVRSIIEQSTYRLLPREQVTIDFTILRRRRYGKEVNYGKPEGFAECVDKICSIFQRAQEQGYLTVKIAYVDDRPADISEYLI